MTCPEPSAAALFCRGGLFSFFVVAQGAEALLGSAQLAGSGMRPAPARLLGWRA